MKKIKETNEKANNQKKITDLFISNTKEKRKLNGNSLTTMFNNKRIEFEALVKFAAIETFASGTSVCESSFSALTRFERPQRLTS